MRGILLLVLAVYLLAIAGSVEVHIGRRSDNSIFTCNLSEFRCWRTGTE